MAKDKFSFFILFFFPQAPIDIMNDVTVGKNNNDLMEQKKNLMKFDN